MMVRTVTTMMPKMSKMTIIMAGHDDEENYQPSTTKSAESAMDPSAK